MNKETQERAINLKSAFNADRRVLQEKIDDLEGRLTARFGEIKSLQKIHMLTEAENNRKNEINFFNGKVSTLRRDLEYQQTFAETLQSQNEKLKIDVESMARVLDIKEKEL